MTLGGGMEIVLHCDRVHAAAETYMGQVEMGVGLLPGGGGNKELLYRYIEGIPEGLNVDLLPYVQKAFEAIAMATVATSARHAQELGLLRSTDKVSVNQDFLIHDAKQTVLGMLKEGYEPPRTKAVQALGDYGIAAFKAGVQNMRWGNYISDHDMKIALEIATVLCGGNIRPKTMVSEQYLLDIEREAFLRLIGEEKTQERIMSLLTTGKAVRN
jgi:3-hydroxyacyl-CoA dehydrogenase